MEDYSLLIQQINGLVYYKNKNLTYETCNQNFADFLGCSIDEIVGKDDRALNLPETWYENANLDEATLDKGVPSLQLSQTLISPSHQKLLVITQKIPIFDKENKIVGVLSLSEKNVDQGSHNQIFYTHMINYLPYYIFWKDSEFRYQGCNDNFAKLIGRKDKEDVIGLTDYELGWGEGEADAFRAADIEIVNNKHIQVNNEEVLKRNDGSEIVMLVSKIPVCNDDGEVIGLLGISTDITKLKNAEKKLIIANKAKSDFIANMSHDLRTPITGMLAMVQDMLNSAEESKASQRQSTVNVNDLLSRLIEIIERDGELLMGATDELLQLCNEILEVARLESGAGVAESESFDLVELVQHNIELLQPVARHKQLELSYAVDSSLPQYFKGLRIYLDRVLLNLISNALKFTEKGFVKVTVMNSIKSKEYKVGDAIAIEIVVEDSGMGIPQDKQEIIFEHFSRLTPAYQGLYKGAGLGLYTVKRYIAAMKGQITVESEAEQGAKFKIIVPLKVSDHSSRENTSFRVEKRRKLSSVDVIEEASEATGENQILVVEDNTLAAIAVRLALKPFGCSIEVAENGEQALKRVQEKDYDLILMDVGLPDISGVEVTRRIRALSGKTSEVPIVALTGHANEPEKRADCLAAGMQEVLGKPAQALALESVLHRYVFQSVELKAELKVDKEIVDWEGCVHMCNGDPQLTRDLFKLLIEDLTQTKEKFATYSGARDLQSLRDELHRLRGGLCYLKLPRLMEALKVFHHTVKVEPENTKQFNSDYEAVLAAMDEFLAISHHYIDK